jgi:flavin-dependent dehydrogenase
MAVLDLLIVGAGPSGLATAIAARQHGFTCEILEKGVLVNSIFHFPAHMVFFTTPELLEIGGLPLVTPYDKPTRIEALRYYRRVAEKFELPITFGRRHQWSRTSVLLISPHRAQPRQIRRARATGPRPRARDWLLRSSEPPGSAW